MFKNGLAKLTPVRACLAIRGVATGILLGVLLYPTESEAQSSCLQYRYSPSFALLNYCNDDITVYWEGTPYCESGCMAHIAPNGASSAQRWQQTWVIRVCYGFSCGR